MINAAAMRIFLALSLYISLFTSVSNSFCIQILAKHNLKQSLFPLHSSSISSGDSSNSMDEHEIVEESITNENEVVINEIKKEILSLSASFDRGYGATPATRTKVEDLIAELSKYNPTIDATMGIEDDTQNPPLKGTWRMIWTTAQDVLSIAASPVSTVSAIYQDISNPPIAMNIIDIIPRAQAFFPPSFPSSLTRIKVQTRASRRGPLRAGLNFESVEVKPIDVLGVRVSDTALPEQLSSLSLNFPDISKILGDDFDSPGYFDILYLDDDMLIISQNQPGGKFISIRVPNADL